MATPVVSGAIALLLGAYPTLTPPEVKLILHDSAIDSETEKKKQGWGRIDVKRMLEVGKYRSRVGY